MNQLAIPTNTRSAVKLTDRLAVVVLVAVSAIPFINLRAFPIFVDESIDLWWIWRITAFGEWLRPLGDGKPLEAWPVIPFALLGADPLLADRILHALAGMASVLLVYALVRQMAGIRLAFVSALLTAVCPLMVFYQRMTLADTYLCAAGLFAMLAALRYVQHPTIRAALLLACAMLVAAFAKLPVGFIFTLALPIALLWMPRAERAAHLNTAALRRLVIVYAPIALLLAGIAAVSAYQVLHGQAPGFGLRLVIEKTTSSDRAAMAASNLGRLVDELAAPITWPLAIVALAGIVLAIVRGDWRQRWLATVSALPLCAMMVAASFWGSRYILFAIPLLLVNAVSGWQIIVQRLPARSRVFAGVAVFVVCLGLMSCLSGLRIFAPLSAQWSVKDREYITDWSSGYGFPELADYAQRENAPPVIYTLEVGPAMQLRAYLPAAWQERIQQLQIVGGEVLDYPQRYEYLLAHSPAWLVTARDLDPGEEFVATHLRPIASFTRPMSNLAVRVYEVVR
jgi:4-amino-4-deoxy-L-arabinose transferase-like glycosyltransferase